MNLQRQLDAEKRARIEERQRDRHSVARGIQSEFLAIFEHDLGGLMKQMRTLDPSEQRYPPWLPPSPDIRFPVFEGCASKLGNLRPETVALANVFYKAVLKLACDWREYEHFTGSQYDGDGTLANGRLALSVKYQSAKEALDRIKTLCEGLERDIVPVRQALESEYTPVALQGPNA